MQGCSPSHFTFIITLGDTLGVSEEQCYEEQPGQARQDAPPGWSHVWGGEGGCGGPGHRGGAGDDVDDGHDDDDDVGGDHR